MQAHSKVWLVGKKCWLISECGNPWVEKGRQGRKRVKVDHKTPQEQFPTKEYPDSAPIHNINHILHACVHLL